MVYGACDETVSLACQCALLAILQITGRSPSGVQNADRSVLPFNTAVKNRKEALPDGSRSFLPLPEGGGYPERSCYEERTTTVSKTQEIIIDPAIFHVSKPDHANRHGRA